MLTRHSRWGGTCYLLGQTPGTRQYPYRCDGCQEAGEPKHAVSRTNETSLQSGVATSLVGQAQVARRDDHIVHGGENRQAITSRIIS